ncbi:MAG: choice-of-anchor E domain-containing protein [Myxococcota bacterium]
MRGWSAGAALALWALVGLGLSGAASAATISFSDQRRLTNVDFSGTLSVPRFDVSLGSLSEVRWTVTGAIASILGATNNAFVPVSGSAHTRVVFELGSTALSFGGSPDLEVIATTGSFGLSPGESALVPITAMDARIGTELPGPGFLGPGTVDLDFATLTSFGASGFGGNLTLSQRTDAAIRLEVVYDFVPVPEPSTAMLMALGLAALASMRRPLR